MGIKEAILHQAHEQGLEQGDEKRIRIAVGQMHKKGLATKEIADFLVVPVEKIQTIIDELENMK